MKLKFIILFLVLTLNSAFAEAQKLQFGAKATLAGSYFLPSSGGFEKSTFKVLPGLTTGAGLAANFYLNKKFTLLITTGLQLQVKTFSFRLYNFNVSNVKGMVSFRPIFISPEMPLIFCAEKERKKKNAYVNYQLGAVLSYNIPFSITGRQKGPFLLEPENDTLASAFDVAESNVKPFSPDLYIGISWVNKTKKRRLSEWGISIQYALSSSATYNFTGYVITVPERKEYAATFLSKLSYVAVHFVFYPKKWISL